MIFLMENITNSPRKYFDGRSYRKDYFESIDEQNKAYILGFLWGDGSYIAGKRTIALALAAKDGEHLWRMAEELYLGRIDIKSHYNRGSFGVEGSEYEYYKIQMSHKTLVQSLEKLGYNKKAVRMEAMPTMPEELRRHFIRGLFDADGCAYQAKPSRPNAIAVQVSLPHQQAVDWWCKFHMETIGVEFGSKRDRSIFAVRIQKGEYLEKFYNFLYTDANLYLLRKEMVFRRIFALRN